MGDNGDTTVQSEPLPIDIILTYFIVTVFSAIVLMMCCKCLRRVLSSLLAVQLQSLPGPRVGLDDPKVVLPAGYNSLLGQLVHATEPSSTDLCVPVSHAVSFV
jgi:hypothetical protein